MMKSAALILLATSIVVEASTKIAVLEFGNGRTVRRSEATSATTSVEGVASFWSALHGNTSSKLQHAGLTVVPDLFSKPDSGLVIGISGTDIDMNSFPGMASLFEMEETVGFMEVPGDNCQSLLDTVKTVTVVAGDNIVKSAVDNVSKNELTALKIQVDGATVDTVDEQLTMMVNEMKNVAKTNEQKFVIHVVIEENVSQSRRRLSSRELEDQQNNQNAEGENLEDDKEYNGYYGYAYKNKYGVWVTPYKTMFQIQYFNVVTWTAIGLGLVLVFCISLMVFMPLEPDTLLFGESAKFVGDE